MSDQEVISFKANHDLVQLLKSVRNRSEFIRNAVLAAFNDTCPLCHGSGFLDGRRRQEWENFSHSHPQTKCRKCHELVFTCDGKPVKHECARS